MGVKRLFTLLKTTGGVCTDVNIIAMAEEYRLKYKKDPEIVIDAYSLIRKLYEKLDRVCGGEFTQFVDNIKSFIRRFQGLKIHLVLFFDGAVLEHKRKEWINRRENNLGKTLTVFRSLKSGNDVSSINHHLKPVLPEGLGYVMSHVFKNNNCKVRRSVNRECDEDIVIYAKQKNCLAILADDSDFVIYQSGSQYTHLSLECLNVLTMVTKAYNQSALSKSLNLNNEDLPIWASLMGNDHISLKQLEYFHTKLVGCSDAYVTTLAPKIADYVRTVPKKKGYPHDINAMSMDVFGTVDKSNVLKKSIQLYSPSEFSNNDRGDCDALLKVARKKCYEMISPGFIHNVLEKLLFESSTLMEVYDDPKLQPSGKVLKVMRQRIYGVLLRDRCSQPEVHEYCMIGKHSLDRAQIVKAVVPLIKAPQLLRLWEENSEALIDTKFQLLTWMSSEKLSLKNTVLRKYPPHLICAVCALSFLYWDAKELEELDVLVFASVVVDTQHMNSMDLSNIHVYKADIRGVHLATLFLRTITHIFFANAACGNAVDDEYMLHQNLFNGKLFQDAYLKRKSDFVEPRKGSYMDFKLLCDAVLL